MQIGQWELIDQIGNGGGGTVYKARDINSDQLVALKQMSVPVGVDGESQNQRFLREARALAKVNSDFVVRLYASQIIDGKPVLVMEYLSGGSLGLEIAQGAFTADRVVRLLTEALQGLAAVHEAGLIHRDIKPTNILRSDSGRYKIADFGISDQVGSMYTMHAGTAQYAAPEYVSDPANIDGRADMYSLGLAAYEAALGRQEFQKALQQHAGVDPYVATAQWQAWLADATKEVPPLHHVTPSVPLELSKLISRLLAKDPARRFPSCAAALDELKQLDLTARGQTAAAEPKPEETRKADQAPAKKKKAQAPVLLIAASVSVTLLVGIAALVLKPRAKASPAANVTADVVKPLPPPPAPKEPDPPPAPKEDIWTLFEQLADKSAERLQISNVRAAYGVGDSMAIDVVLPRAGYLNLLTVSEITGTATVLFPNDFVKDNHFAQAQTVRLPAPGSRYRLEFQLPAGAREERNLLVAFLTAQPVNARALASDASAFHELTVTEAEGARAAIVLDDRYAAGKQPYLLNGAGAGRPPSGTGAQPQGAR